jgi:hypothetical protein
MALRTSTITSNLSRFSSASLKRSLLVWLGITLSAHAVVIDSGGPNNTAPSGQPYFGNVGVLNGASAIYLSDRWVMSANHVAGFLPGSVSFGGTSYTTQAGSWQRLNNTGLGMGLSTLTDIVLFRLTSSPGLPSLSVRTSAPTVGDDVMMIGNGKTQAASLTYWDVTVVAGPNNDVWAEVTPPTPYDLAGFKTTPINQVRWGVNEVSVAGITANAGNGDVRSFATLYNPGFTHEAQGVNGDSGGATLFFNGASWELSGMMHAINAYENQPAPPTHPSSAIHGQSTFHADLSLYAPQINAILATVPEPGSFMLLGFSTLLILTRRIR